MRVKGLVPRPCSMAGPRLGVLEVGAASSDPAADASPGSVLGWPARSRVGAARGHLDVLGLGQVLVRPAVVDVRERTMLARRALARAGAASKRLSVGVQPVLRQAAQELVSQLQVLPDHAPDAQLRTHRKVSPDVAKQRARGVRKVAAIGGEALERILAGAKHTLVVDVQADVGGILDDLVGKRAIDRVAESMRVDRETPSGSGCGTPDVAWEWPSPFLPEIRNTSMSKRQTALSERSARPVDPDRPAGSTPLAP